MTKRPAPIFVSAEWGDTTCSCCGVRYWLEVRVMEEPPALDVADGEEDV